MRDSTHNLLFLLAAAPLATGCIVVTSDDVSDDSTSGDGDGDPTTTGDGDGDPTTGDGDGDPATGDGDGDPTTGDGDGDPTTGDGDGDPTTGDGDGDGDPAGACEAYAAQYDACLGSQYYAENVAFCQEAIDYNTTEYGAECGAAIEAMFACLSLADCEVFETPDVACPDELAQVQLVCGGGLVVNKKLQAK